MEKFNRKFGGIVILILANAVFFALYYRFFTGDAVYLYTDIGSDSTNSSLPIISMLQRLVELSDYSGYSLNAGLGSSTLPWLLKYLNPMKLPLLLFGGSRLPIGIIVELLIQTNVTALFSWLFMRRLLGHGTAALFASLAWTFSAYITLWSQNLTTGCCMAMFTVVMAALLPVIEKPTLRRNLVLTLVLALFLMTDYYYCYMTAFFVLVFLIFWSAANGRSFAGFFVSGLEILGCAVFAGVLAAFALIPSLTGFTGSGRTSALSIVHAKFQVLNARELFSLLGRLFSANTLGVGNAYNGTMNYYEEALLSTTVLAVVAVIYLLAREETRLITFFAVITACAALLIKNTGSIVQFNIGVQRYSFMIAFAETIAVGFFIRAIMTQPYSIPLFWSVIISLALLAAVFLFLAVFDTRLGLRTDLRPLKFAAAVAAAFSVLLIIYALGFRISSVIPYICLMVLMAELVFMNYDTIFERSLVSGEQYQEIMSGGGCADSISGLRKDDPELYRISASTDTDLSNLGMLLDFPSVSVYNNTNPTALSSLTKAHGTCELSPNHFMPTGFEFGQLQLLSAKYLIRPASGLSADTPVSAFYEQSGTSADGKNIIYKSKDALPFGYFYTRQISAADAKELSLPERIVALSQAYYRTDGISTVPGTEAEEESEVHPEVDSLFAVTDLLMSGRNENHLKQRKTSSGIVFQPTGGDPYLYYNIGEAKKDSVRMLYIRLKSTAFNRVRHMQIFYMSGENEDPDPADSRLFFLGRGYPEMCLLIPDDVVRIRLDFPEDYLDTNVTELDLLESTELGGMFRDLSDTDISDISMQGNTYSAEVNAKKSGMLCIPLLYSGNWTASVNGTKTDVSSINGGLTGIPLEAGISQVVLKWETPFFYTGLVLSAAVLIAWVVLFAGASKFSRSSSTTSGRSRTL